MHMKDPLEKTKAVLRHLPPAISQSALMDQIDARFAGRYKWASFRPGKTSNKSQRFSRAYIDFTNPEDVVEFAEYFGGHIFVNEKGAQFKVLVEYAPSQRAPKAWSKKDGREASILKDPEYLEFLDLLAKPVVNLPSAEVQLERKEAERAGGIKEALIVTPLMDFVRQRRAAKIGSQRASVNGKLGRRVVGASVGTYSPSKRVTEKKKLPASMFVVRDSIKSARGKDKSAYILVPRKESKLLFDVPDISSSARGTEVIEEENVNGSSETSALASGVVKIGKRFVLLKGKERDTSHVSDSSLQQQNSTSSVRNGLGSTASKRSQHHEASGRIIRSILSNKEGRQGQLYNPPSQSEQQTLANSEKEKHLSRPPSNCLFVKDSNPDSISIASAADTDGKRHVDDKVGLNDLYGSAFTREKKDRRRRNKDKPDHGVWTLRHSDMSHGSDETQVYANTSSDSLEGVLISQQTTGVTIGDDEYGIRRENNTLGPGVMNHEMPNLNRNLESKNAGGGRASSSPIENGSYRHVGRRGPAHGQNEADSLLNWSDGKPSKRGSGGYGYHERQVWVQKSGSAS